MTEITPSFAQAEIAERDLEIKQLKRERDAAFGMSSCQCSHDECCYNLVKHIDRAEAAEARVASLEALVDRIKVKAETMIVPDDELSNDLVKYSFQRGINKVARSLLAEIGGGQ